MNKHTFHVSGMHCASCQLLIEEVLQEQSFVNQVEVNLKKATLTISTNDERSPEILAEVLTNLLRSNGYTVSTTKTSVPENETGIIWQALPIGLAFLALFFLLQKSGWLNLGLSGGITPITSFIIGLIASVSSCLAIVGGLVLSLSAKISQDKVSDTKVFMLFHIGRLVSFAVLGGFLGVIGNAIGLNLTVSAILGLVAALVMIVLGLNLAGVFKKSGITLPSGLFKLFRGIEHKTFAPLLVGFGTFFLPCGFTQSMQVAALSSGSFLTGAWLMLAFALGTLPVLALLSFGSASFAYGKQAPLFFTTAGVVVIGLGVFSFLSGLAGLGLITPLFNI